MKNNKKQIIKITVFITSIFIIFMSISFAFINLTLQGTKRQVIQAGNLALELEEDENNLTIQNALPMYDEVGMTQEAFTFRLINNGTVAANYTVKLVEIGTGTLEKSDVKYGLTKDGVDTIGLLSDLTDGVIDSGTIGKSPETIEYELRLWVKDTVVDNSSISGKSLSYKVNVEVSQEIASNMPKVASELVSKNLGDNCATYDDGVDTFLVGQCANNYVWYSGKLWRVVLKNNETGAVKMVTDNSIASISHNSTDGYNTDFKNSYLDQWLNQEFLPTLHDYEEYLITDYVWDATMNSSTTPIRPKGTTSVERTVGLLNTYELYTTYSQAGDLATSETAYLNNGVFWWLMTPTNYTHVQGCTASGSLGNVNPHNATNTRPAINLKSTIQIDSGSGSQSDPYILKGDTQETVGGTTLLSTRYSGEYITFNNELYRIVAVENGLTKITAVDTPASLVEIKFHTYNGVVNFAEASIKTDLENYYQNLDSVWKDMIQPNTTWYLGAVGDDDSFGNYHYKASICANVDASISASDCARYDEFDDTTKYTTANIGLPRAGEMFTTQITRGTKVDLWTLTPYDDSLILRISSKSSLGNSRPQYGYGARPSIYLKSNIVIASTNTGNGTYEYPYSIQ